MNGYFDFFGFDGSNESSVAPKVSSCIHIYEQGDIPALQQALYELYLEFNCRGGGGKIISFERKDQLCECFTMMLQFDWMHDSDIREVWAEDGFYCIAEYLNNDVETMQDMVAAAMDLFLLLHYGEKSLFPKVDELLQKAAIRARMGGPESQIFSKDDFYGGANYLFRQFKFFAATFISKIERQHPQVVSPAVRSAYEEAKTDFELASIPMDKLLAKMKFISHIIGSILEDQ